MKSKYIFMNSLFRLPFWYRCISSILLISTMSLGLNATHIVGGDMTYECLGDDLYEITLTVRRDCINGLPEADFDDPVSIGIFDPVYGNQLNAYGYFGELIIPFANSDTLDLTITSDCGFVGSQVCVQQAIYKKTVKLPFRKRGFLLAYQRCCRNITLNNILEPLETGSTYFVTIGEDALNSCNSSPVFDNWADIYICANDNLVFDHSAIDAEGDSLVYRLCTPNSGATSDDPKPQPPAKPPYNDVTFQAPYSLEDMLGGVPLKIDPNTGVITAVPGLIGQFLVGVCVDEYRDGKLLSTVKRDFEYNVRVCSEGPVASFDNPTGLCNSLTTTFNNTSTTTDSYTWYFDYPNTDPALISHEENPTFTFPSIGQYEVRLEAKRNLDGCFTEFSQIINVVNGDLSASIDASVSSCNGENIELTLNGVASDSNTNFDITEYNWTITQGDIVETLSGASVTIDVDRNIPVEVSLIVVSESGCEQQVDQTINVNDYLATPSFDAEMVSCNNDGFTVSFTDTTVGQNSQVNSWSWTIIEGNNTHVSTDNPFVLTVSNINNVEVTLVVGLDNGCTVQTQQTIEMMGGAPTIDFSVIVAACQNDGYMLSLQDHSDHDGFVPSTYDWTITYQNGLIDNYSGSSVEAFVESGSVVDIALAVSYENSCVFNSIKEDVNVDQLIEATELDFSVKNCENNGQITVSIWASVDNDYTLVSHNWEITVNDEIINATGESYVLTAYIGDVVNIISTTIYENGCTKISEQTYTVEGVSIEYISEEFNICKGATTLIVANPNESWEYTWSPSTGLDFSNTTNNANPTFVGTESTTYTLTISNGECSIQSNVTINVFDKYELIISGASTSCDGNVNLTVSGASNESQYIWSLTSDFTEILYTGNALSTTQTAASQTYYATTQDGDCSSKVKSIEVVLTDLDVSFTSPFTACNGDVFIYSVQLGADVSTIQWDNDSHIVSGANTSSPVIRVNENETEDIILNFTATNTEGCIQNYEVVINISQDPSLSFNANLDCGTTIICLENTSNLISNDQMWDLGNGTTISAIQDTCVDYGSLGTYDIRLFSDSQVCGGSAVNTSVIIGNSDILTIIGDTISCDGNITLSVTGGSSNDYEWSTDNQFNTIIGSGSEIITTVEENGQDYYVQVVGNTNCQSNIANVHIQDGFFDLDFSTPFDICPGDEVAFDIFPDPNIMESILFESHPNIIGDLATTTPVISVLPGQSGSFTITFTATSTLGCTKTMDVLFNIVSNPIASFEANSDCMSTTVCFTNTTPAGNGGFVWDFGDGSPQVFVHDTCYTYLQEGSYHVSLSNFGSSCKAITNVKTVDVYQDANLTINGQTMICNGSVALAVTSANSTGGYIWSDDAEFTNILSTNNILITPMVGESYTLYVMTDENASCAGLDSITVIAEEFVVEFETPLAVCQGDKFVYNVTSNYPNVHFKWEDSPFVIENGDTANPTIYIPNDQTEDVVLSFTACTQAGCLLDLVVTFEVNPAPVLSYTYEQQCGTTTVCFVNASSPFNSSQMWDFGDGSALIVAVDTCYAFADNGVYAVSLLSESDICAGTTYTNNVVVSESSYLSITGDTVSCDGSVNLMVTGAPAGSDYEWSTSSDFDIIISNGSVLNTTMTGTNETYYVQVVGNEQCLSNVAFAFVNDGFFDLEFDTPLDICNGDNVEYNVIPDPSIMTSILWDAHPNIIGDLDVFNPNIVVPIDQIGSFVLSFTATSVQGCTRTMEVTFIIVSNPIASFDYTTDCTGTTVCFTNTTSNHSGDYFWDFGDGTDVVISQETEVCHTYADPATYDVSLSNISSYCQAISATQSVAVLNEVILNITGSNMICNGQINLSVSGALPGDNYIWATNPNFNQIVTTGDTYTNTLTKDSLTVYVMTDADAVCPGMASITIYNDMFDVVFVSPFDACAGDQFTYTVVSNDPTVEFLWDDSPYIISGNNTSSPTLSIPTDHTDPITLSFTATNDAGCVMNSEATINVVERPVLDFSYSLECGTLEVCFEASPIGLNQYFWQFGQGGFPTAGQSVCHTYSAEGTYNVTLSTISAYCQALPTTMSINVQLLDPVTITGDQYSCDGNTNLMANGAGAGDGFLWSTSPSMDPIISIDNPLVYPMTQDTQTFYVVTNGTASCQSDTVSFEVIDASFDLTYDDTLSVCSGQEFVYTIVDNKPEFGTSILWAMDSHIIANGDTFMPTISVGSDETGEFVLSYTLSNAVGCEATYDVLFSISSELDMTFNAILDECGSFTMCFENTNQNSNVEYFWDFGDTTTQNDTITAFDPGCYTYPSEGTYTVTLSANSLACGMMQITQDILVPEAIDLQVTSTSTAVCAGQDFVIQAISNNNAMISYCLENGEVLGSGSEIIVNFETDTTVLVKALDENGCTDTVSVFVDMFEFDLTANGPDAVVCAGDIFEISVINADPTGNYTYLWSPAECVLAGIDSATPVVSATESKIMTVVVTNTDLGCSTTVEIPLEISTVDANIFPDIFGEIKAGVEVELTAQGGGDNAFYEWSNDNTINTSTQIVAPTETTTYVVTVTDEFACSGTAEYILEVRDALCNEEDVFVPSAFTPNNDGINDVLYVRSAVVESMEFTVTDRWGKELFVSRNINFGWDGTFKGENLAPDAYAYCIKATCINQETYVKSGNVNLLR